MPFEDLYYVPGDWGGGHVLSDALHILSAAAPDLLRHW
jgi:hypothetical protein